MTSVKYGVYYDLEESTYKVDSYGLTFYFSSTHLMNKFKREVHDFVERSRHIVRSQYSVDFNIDALLAYACYTKCERRGNRVLKEGSDTWQFELVTRMLND